MALNVPMPSAKMQTFTVVFGSIALAAALVGCPAKPDVRRGADAGAEASAGSSAPAAIATGAPAASSIAPSSGSAEPAWKKTHADRAASASASATSAEPAPKTAPKKTVGAMTSEFHSSRPHLAIAEGDELKIVDVTALSKAPISMKAAGEIQAISWASQVPSVAVLLNRQIQVFDSAGGDAKHTFDALTFDTDDYFVPEITLSHDGKHVAAAFDNKLYLWRAETGEAVPLENEDDLSWGNAFVADNKMLATYTAGGVVMRRLEDGKVVHNAMFDTGATSPLAVSPDGSFLAVSESQHALLSYRIGKRETKHLDGVDGCENHLSMLRFSKNSKLLAVRSDGGYWRSWNLPTLSPRTTFDPKVEGSSWLSEDGGSGIVLVAGEPVVFDAYKNKKRDTLDGYEGGANVDFHFSADSRYVATRFGEIAVLGSERRQEAAVKMKLK